MAKLYLSNLTALRGIAAVLVATLHFHFFLGGIVPYKNAGMVDKLYLMVDLFFILSGFIICYVYEDHFGKAVLKKDYKKFLIARLARIYPLHFFSLVTEIFIFLILLGVGKFSLLPGWQQHLYRVDAIPVQLTFLQTIGIYNFDTWNAPAWSLSAEWWAYVLFPFLFILFRGIGYKKWFIAGGIAIAGWLSIEFFLSGLQPFMNHAPNPATRSLDVNWYFGTLRGIVGFIAGMSIWQIYKTSKFKDVLGSGWSLIVLLIASLLSMQFKWFDTITVCLFALIILSSAYGSDSINKFYAFKPFEKLGKWSFSIYMWHMVIINSIMLFFVLGRDEPVKGILRPFRGAGQIETLGYLLLFLVFVGFVGFISYKYIENPTRAWIKTKIANG